MKKNKYLTINQLLDHINPPNRKACRQLLEDNLDLFKKAQGSTNNHQAWPGGYYDHIEETLNIANLLYDTLSACRPLPFSKSDLLLVVFLHDLEKPWKYKIHNGELHYNPDMNTKTDHLKFKMKKIVEYNIKLTAEQKNGIEYAEGEFNNYSNKKRNMGSLACVAHMSDVASARLWFDFPKNKNTDPWKIVK